MKRQFCPYALFWYSSLLFPSSHLPISPPCSDTDWRRNSVLVWSKMLAAICLLGRAQWEMNRWMRCVWTPDNISWRRKILCVKELSSGLIVFPRWLQWCVLSPKGQRILLIGLSHATERKRQSDTRREVLIVVSGAFFPCGDVTGCQSRGPQGAHTLNEGPFNVPPHVFSVISLPSFNCAPFIFGIHLFSFSSSSVSYPVCPYPSSARCFYPLHSAHSFPHGLRRSRK